MRAYIVAKNQIDRAMIARMLQRGPGGIESVVELSEPSQCEVAFAAAAPSVVLLDIGSGAEGVDSALPFISQYAPRVPIVVLTEATEHGDLAKVLTAHAQDLLRKWEFNANDLHRSIRYAMGRHQSAEELRRARAVAVAASEAKTRFLASMSHEIRTPLGAMLGMAEVLAGSSLSHEQRKQVDVLREAGQHLLGVINDVLDMGRIEAGAVLVERQVVDVRALAKACVKMLHGKAEEKRLALSCDVSPTVPDTLVLDAQRVRQILINLLGNAIKFTERGAVALRVAMENETGRLRFVVEDSGPGIPADRHAAIFDRFVQAEDSTSRTHGGTGLGLAISRGLAELMTGSLTLTSEVGQGSRFTLVLPSDEAAIRSESKPAPAAQPPARSRSRVLVVEDTPGLQALMHAFFQGSEHTLEIFGSGSEVMARLERDDVIDLVMLDLHLPGMDGFETLKQIRARERQSGRASVPAIAMSADVSAEVRSQCFAAGFVEFLPKPFPRRALLASIERWAGHGASTDELAGDDDADVRRLLPGFLSACRSELAAAEAACAERDFTRTHELGHRLKGSGASFGLPELAEAGRAMEVAAKRADTDGVAKALQTLAASLRNAERTVAGPDAVPHPERSHG